MWSERLSFSWTRKAASVFCRHGFQLSRATRKSVHTVNSWSATVGWCRVEYVWLTAAVADYGVDFLNAVGKETSSRSRNSSPC